MVIPQVSSDRTQPRQHASRLAAGVCPLQAQAAHRTEQLQQHKALRHGRRGQDVIGAKRGGQGFEPARAVLRQIVAAQQSTAGVQARHELRPHFALVERPEPVLRDARQAVRQRRLTQDLAAAHHATVGMKEHTPQSRIQAEPGLQSVQVAPKRGGHRHAVSRECDGVFEQARPGQAPALCMQIRPSGDHTRHRDRMHAVDGHRGVLAPQGRGIERRRRSTAAAECANASIRKSQQRLDVATDRTHVRVDDRQHRAGRDGGIDSGATIVQRSLACLGGQGMG